MKGIDYSLWRPPSTSWLLDQGYGFVCRYLSYGTQLKVIDRAEYQALRQAGLQVVLVWEYGAQDMLGGYTAGTGDAKAALQQAQALGAWPCPIYFAADWDVTPQQEADVQAYLKAGAFVLGGAQRVGIYGGFYPVSAAMNAGLAHYGWQTYSWSGGQWFPDAQLRQVPGGTQDYDLDESLAADFGQVGGDPMSDDQLRALVQTWAILFTGAWASDVDRDWWVNEVKAKGGDVALLEFVQGPGAQAHQLAPALGAPPATSPAPDEALRTYLRAAPQ